MTNAASISTSPSSLPKNLERYSELLNPYLIEAELASRSLSKYIGLAWHIVEPATPYCSGWHIEAIAEHLEALTRGELRNLIINIPPRHMKSLSVAVFWPTWVWAKHPEVRWMFSSYAEDLALRDSVKCRRVILSDWYQKRYGHVFSLTGDQNQKRRFENSKGGYRLALGVGGGSTGEGGDIIVVDDPLKAQEGTSQATLDNVIEWWDETMSTRGNDPRKVRKVIIMQRLHQRDLTGHSLAKMREEGGEQWEHLCLPAEYEQTVRVTALGWRDPRSTPGELLWPQRFGPEEMNKLKVALGERGTAGQLQQRPAPIGGAVYKREWWETEHRYDPDESLEAVGRFMSCDTALKDKESNDYSAITVWDMLPDYRIALRHVWKGKPPFPVMVRRIEEIATKWQGKNLLKNVVIEDKQSGTTAVQTLRQTAPEWLQKIIVEWIPRGDKVYRARQASLWCERGRVLLPHPSESVPWLMEFEEEFFDFPAAAYDDVTDTVSQLIIYLEYYLAASWQRELKRGRAA